MTIGILWDKLKCRRSQSLSGVSLAETLVVMALVGLLMMPILLTSTTYFSSQMIKIRQRLSLTHNTGMLLSQLYNQLGATVQLIPSTTAETFDTSKEFRYTFYDSVRGRQVYGGLRLTDIAGSRRTVQALDYSSGSWSAISPYKTLPATAYTLPSTATFSYCLGTTCGVSADQATYIRLSSWVFRDESAPSRTYTLPTTDIYLNSLASQANKIPGHQARLLYSSTPSQMFGRSGLNLSLMSLSPSGKTLWAMPESMTGTGGVAAGLMTIASSLNAPGQYSMHVDEARGQVYFFTSSGQLFQWNSLLTTAQQRIAAGANGQQASIVSSYTGRVYFGCNTSTCNLRYYDPVTNTVSTITSGAKNLYGLNALVSDPTRRVIYAGWNNSPTDSGLIMFNEDTGTITTIDTMSGSVSNAETLSLNPTTGRLYYAFRKSAPSVLKAWTPAKSGVNFTTGTLTTVPTGSGLVSIGAGESIHALPKSNNQVVFGDNSGLYAWQDGNASITTIISSVAGSIPAASYSHGIWPGALRSIHHFDFRYSDSGNIVYWAQSGSLSGVYAYNLTTGVLSTLTPTAALGVHRQGGLLYDSNIKALFWSEGGATDPNNKVYRWNETTNTLQTLLTGLDNDWGRYRSIFTTPDSAYLFAGMDSPYKGHIYNLNASTLSTMTAGPDRPGNECSVQDPATGRVFFCGNNGAAGFYSWHPSTGLTTLVTTTSGIGRLGSVEVDSIRKYAVIGSNSLARPVYVWSYGTASSPTTGSLYKATEQGQPAGSVTFSFTPSGFYNYVASAVDKDRLIYLINRATNQIDRYRYNVSNLRYELDGTMQSSSTVIGSICAAVIDPASAGMAILNGNTKMVYVLSDRSTSGSVSPASSFSVSDNTEPTGMAMDRRTGEYYIVDSNVSSSQIRIRRYTSAGVYRGSSYDLVVTVSDTAMGGTGLGATSESNFKISFNELKNQLYLMAPNVGRVYVLAVPEPAA